MGKYPYTTASKKFRKFLEDIKGKIGVPTKVDRKWLQSIGFGRSQGFISILKFIGFVDESGVPTDKWKDFRAELKSKRVMAEAIKEGYSELYSVYPEAHTISDKKLKDFFTPHTEGADKVQTALVSTFKALCSFADFEASAPPDQRKSKEEEKPPPSAGKLESIPELHTMPSITIRIELSLPETENMKVYENFFKAMYDYLIKPSRNE